MSIRVGVGVAPTLEESSISIEQALPQALQFGLGDAVDLTNLHAHYLHPESDSTWLDQSDNNFDLSVSGSITRQGSTGDFWNQYDQASFTVRNEIAYSAPWGMGNSDFTVAGRFKCSDTGQNRTICGHADGWLVRTNGTAVWAITPAGGSSQITAVSGVVLANEWNYFIYRKEGSNVYLSVNSSAEDTDALGTDTLTAYSGAFRLGCVTDSFRPCEVAEIAIFKENFSASDRERLNLWMGVRHIEYYADQASSTWLADKSTVLNQLVFDNFNSAAFQTLIGSSDSSTMINNSYRLRSLCNAWLATMDHSFLDELLLIEAEYRNGARASSTFGFTNATVSVAGQYLTGATSSRLGWRSDGGGLDGQEGALFEGYFAGIFAWVLNKIKAKGVHTHPTYSAQYNAAVTFWEDNYWRKWYERGTDSAGNGTLFRQDGGTHISSHPNAFALYMRTVSTDSTLVAQYNTALAEYFTNNDGTPAEYQNTNIIDSIENHPVDGASSLAVPDEFGTTVLANPDDTSHWWHINLIFQRVFQEFFSSGYVSQTLIDRMGFFLTNYEQGAHPIYMNHGSGTFGSGFTEARYQLVSSMGELDIDYALYIEGIDFSNGTNRLDAFGAQARNKAVLLNAS